MAEDKIEYSRLILKRSGISGEEPTIPTGTTLNEMVPTDLFVGEMFINVADDLLWVRTENNILPISLSGSTGTTTPSLMEVLYEGNITGLQDIIVSSGATIQYEGLNTGVTTTVIGIDSSGNTLTTQRVTYNGVNDNLQVSGNTLPGSLPRFTALGSAEGSLPDFGIAMGTRPYNNVGNQGYGKTGDTFVYASRYANGLNIINTAGTGTTEDYIRFYAGEGATSPSHVHIQGSGSTKGYVGINNETPTERLDVDGNIKTSGTLEIGTLGTNPSVYGLGIDSNGIVVTGATASDLESVLVQGNTTGLNDIIVSSGASIIYEYLPTGSTSQFLAIDADGRTIIATGGSGTSGTSGLSGVNGTNGTSGIDGLSNSFFNYKAKTSSTSGDPGSGYLLWNNAIQSDTTAIHISETDDNSNNVDIFLANLKSGTTITIQDQSDHTNYQTWEIGTPIDNSTYWELPVILITSTYTFSNNEDVLFIVSSIPSGTSGTSGSSGTSGINGTDGFNGTSGTSGIGTSGTSGSSGTSGGGSITYSNLTELPGQMVWNVLGAGSATTSRSKVAGGLMYSYNQTITTPTSSTTPYLNTIILEPGETLTTITWGMQVLTGETISMGLYSLSAVTGNNAISYTLGNLVYTITTGTTFNIIGTADRNITGLNYTASANTSPNNVYVVVMFATGAGLRISKLNNNNLIAHVGGGSIGSNDYYRTYINTIQGGTISGITLPSTLNTVTLNTTTAPGWFFTYKTQ